MLMSKPTTLVFKLLLLNLLASIFSKVVDTAFSAHNTPCTLPPDFWCDHPDVSLACTGSSVYCDGYKANRRGRPIQMHLAFESACPDSQQFVVHRLYPKVLSHSSLTPSMVEFRAVPWGLARRVTAHNVKQNDESSVRCHHGERECTGNRYLTCAMLHYQNDEQKKNQLFYCFMQKMMSRGDPNLIIDQCLSHLATPAHEKNSIINCGKGPQATDLQKADEAETSKILSTPRFVPFISINGVGHIHMQAHQMILNEKVKAWDSTVKKPPVLQNASSKCNLPPDFWCSDATITSNCYTPTGCSEYLNAIYGRPVHIKVIFSPQLAISNRYVLGYLKPHFLSSTNTQNDGKVVLELEPAPISASELAQCDAGCQQQGLLECVATKFTDIKERTNQIICLMEARGANRTNSATSIRDLWAAKCGRRNEAIKNSVLNCFNTQAWRQLTTQRAANQQALRPEPRRREPWIVINGFSLESIQEHGHILHRLICLWYRGPNHNREHCARCEYEPTSC